MEFTINRIEMGSGWVCFQGGENPPPPDQLPYVLNEALNEWLMRNPEFKVTSCLPIVVNANTVAINVWFE